MGATAGDAGPAGPLKLVAEGLRVLVGFEDGGAIFWEVTNHVLSTKWETLFVIVRHSNDTVSNLWKNHIYLLS